MTFRKLRENATLESSDSGKWRVRIIREGKSLNGVTYPPDILQNEGKVAWPNGTRMMANHDQMIDWTGGDIRQVAGKLITDPEYIPGDGLWADVQIGSQWRDFVEEFSEQIGLSVVVAAEARDSDYGPVVTKLYADPYNSVDLVIAPSAGGQFSERLAEAYEKISGVKYIREGSTESSVTDSHKEREGMNEEDRKAIAALFTEALTPFATALAEMGTKVEGLVTVSESVTAAKTEQVAAVEVAAKLAEAKLSEKAMERFTEAVKSGQNPIGVIETEVARRAEYLAEAQVTPDPVHTVGSDGKRPSIASILGVSK